MNIMNSPLENLDIEILDKLVWLSVVENDIIWLDSVYWELQISIPELWIINILPSCKVKLLDIDMITFEFGKEKMKTE